jgi:hypothetical protein
MKKQNKKQQPLLQLLKLPKKKMLKNKPHF